MRRLAPLDKTLLAIFAPLWAVSFALTVHTALRPVHFSLVFTSLPATADAAPMVAAFRPYLRGETALRRGDLLLRLGDRDLRGVNPLEFQALVLGQTRAEPFRVEFERAGERAETELPTARYAVLIWPLLPASFGFAVVAILGFLRAAPSPMIRAGCLGLMSPPSRDPRACSPTSVPTPIASRSPTLVS